MTAAELKRRLTNVPDEATVYVDDEPIGDVELILNVAEPFAVIWSVKKCEETPS